jgi:hypothetical protein
VFLAEQSRALNKTISSKITEYKKGIFNMLREEIKKLLPQIILNWSRKRSNIRLFRKWESEGCPVPTPHLYKQRLIQEYRMNYNYSTLVETGTYLGDMVEAQRVYFDEIISVELSATLYRNAKNRFKRAKHITIYEGDSGKVLPFIMKNLNKPAIFWLDGHYSKGITAKGDKECPIFEELDAIFSKKDLPHVLLIDDARCFVGNAEYPTIDALSDFIMTNNDKYQISVERDIIRAEIPTICA